MALSISSLTKMDFPKFLPVLQPEELLPGSPFPIYTSILSPVQMKLASDFFSGCGVGKKCEMS